MTCPKCQSLNLIRQLPAAAASLHLSYFRCADCGYEFVVDATEHVVIDAPKPKPPAGGSA